MTSAVAGMTCLSLVAGGLIAPALRSSSPAIQFAGQARDLVTPETEFASAEFVEPSLVWSFRARTRRFHQSLPLGELPGFMERPGRRFCVLPTREVARRFPQIPKEWSRFESKGWNLVKGRRQELTMLLKP